MNKSDFLKGFAPKTKTVDIDGSSIEINELTLEQRGKLKDMATDPVRGQALIVCMGCTMFDESDIEAVMGLSGDAVVKLADEILTLAGLGGEEAEKN